MASQANNTKQIIERLKNSLIVSCQASDGEPLCAPEHIAALAKSALNGGAAALRLEGANNVEYVRKLTTAPIVGLTKSRQVPESEQLNRVYITPVFSDAAALAAAGADIIALDCTLRPRPDGSTVAQIITRIHEELNKPVWADVATLEEGIAAAANGAEIISTTLSGYTAETVNASQGPDFALLKRLCQALPDRRIIMEGKIWTPEELVLSFESGAYAVVVGSAITRPQLITKRFINAIPKGK